MGDTNYSAWNAIGTGAQSMNDALTKAYQMKRAADQFDTEQALKKAETDKNNIQTKAMSGMEDPLKPGFDLSGNALPAGSPGMSAKDASHMRSQLVTGQQTGQFGLKRAGILAGTLNKRIDTQGAEAGLTSQENTKLDSAKTAAPLLRSALDLNDAYSQSAGDPTVLASALRTKMAKNPVLSGMLQGKGLDPNSIAAVHQAVWNQLAQENPRLINGSTGNPTPEEMANYMAKSAPQLTDSPDVYKAKAGSLYHSGVAAAYEGALGHLNRAKNPDGSFLNQGFGNLAKNINPEYEKVKQMFPELQQGAVQTLSQGHGGNDDLSAAKRVLSNPGAYPPELVNQAKQIAGVQ